MWHVLVVCSQKKDNRMKHRIRRRRDDDDQEQEQDQEQRQEKDAATEET